MGFLTGKLTGNAKGGKAFFREILSRQTGTVSQREAGSGEGFADVSATRRENRAREAAKPQAGEAAGVSADDADSAVGEAAEKAGGKEPGTAGWEEDGSPEKAALEVLESLAASFALQVAQELGKSAEELEAVLQELGMERMDLFSPGDLKTFLLAAENGEGTVSLLTDEGLYQSLRDLTGQLQDLLQADSGIAGRTVEELLRSLPREGETFLAVPEAGQALQGAEVSQQEAAQDAVLDLAAQAEEDGGENRTSAKEPDVTFRTSPEETVQRDPFANLSRAGAKRQETQSGKEQDAAFAPGHNSVPQGEDLQVEASAAPAQTPDTGTVMRQIMDYMKVQMKPDMTSLEMQLHPESLGTVHVQIASRNGVVSAQFIAQNEAVKNVLEGQMVRLLENFQEQGVKVEEIEVSVQTQTFEQNREQGRSQGEEEGSRRSRPNLNLADRIRNPDGEGLTAEEQLAMDMMEANGGTVDYTA
jgi:flagellar hook-length control protein FliK